MQSMERTYQRINSTQSEESRIEGCGAKAVVKVLDPLNPAMTKARDSPHFVVHLGPVNRD